VHFLIYCLWAFRYATACSVGGFIGYNCGAHRGLDLLFDTGHRSRNMVADTELLSRSALSLATASIRARGVLELKF
jgi:hypothetical protein